MMDSSLFDRLIPALTWTFVHSLWQGLILILLAGLVLWLTRPSTAALRYNLLCGLFFLFIGGVLFTFFRQWNMGLQPSQHNPGPFLGTLLPTPLRLGEWIEAATTFLNTHAWWVVLTWFSIFLFKSNQMVTELGHIRRLRQYNTHEVGEDWVIRVQTLARGLGIHQPVLLLQSALVKVPVIMGHVKPLILVPMGMLSHLPPEQVEAMLLHELAHIRRHDYLVNFIQRLSELVFFFNPALLWVSALLRRERESCCDEMAIAHTGNKLQFVEALIQCKEYSMRPPSYAIGFFGPKQLMLHRLNRIVSNRNTSMSASELTFLHFSFLLLIVLVLAVSGKKAPQNVGVSPMQPTAQQVYISEVGPPVFKGEAGEDGLGENRNLLPPPPPLKAMGTGTQANQIEIDVTRQSGTAAFLQVDKDRAAAEERGVKRILVQDLSSPE